MPATHPDSRPPLLIDCHTHLNRYAPDQPARLAERVARLHAEMGANGITHALVLTSYRVTPERPSATEVLRALGDDPRFGVVAGVTHERGRADNLDQLRGLLAEGRLRGLKLYPGYDPFHLYDPELWPVYEAAAEWKVPVMIHTGDNYAPGAKVRYAHPLSVDEVAVDHRETTLVICHLGNPWMMDAAEVIYKNPNVFGDVSGLTLDEFEPRFARLMRSRVNDAIAYINDPEKLMFGTDWPISDPRSYLEWVADLEATPEEREGLMWRNADRVFRLGLAGDDGTQGDGGGGAG